jgi:hypothetical protein
LQPWHAIWEEKMNRTTEFVPDIWLALSWMKRRTKTKDTGTIFLSR